MDLVPPTSPSVITVALPRERTNAKKSAMLRPKCHKIKAEFLLMQRCASYMHKKRKGHTVFANVHPQDQGDWVWLALPKHHCNHQSMSFDPTICYGQRNVYSRIYSIYSKFEIGNLKVIQIWGIPKQRNAKKNEEQSLSRCL